MLEKEIIKPASQQGLAKSQQLATEYAKKQDYIAQLMQQWEDVMESLEE